MKQVFKPWEVTDELPRLEYELASLPESTLVLELLHKAAYRTGLGYSLFAPKHQIGKINTETVSVAGLAKLCRVIQIMFSTVCL